MNINLNRSTFAILTASLLLGYSAHAYLPTIVDGLAIGDVELGTGPIVRETFPGGELATAFEDVALLAEKNVVSIRSVTRVDGNAGVNPFNGQRVPARESFQEGQGSGFVISREGHVLTNNHVVDGAERVVVTLTDGQIYTGMVLGTDSKTDLAVLKIEAENLQPVRFGNSDELRAGQWVAAVGNPFGLASTITSGIISAIGRTGVGITDYEDFIQTDAAINPGNSGGPLFNLRGEVIGINTAIYSRSGGAMGVGFAIPINLAKTVIDDLIQGEEVRRGWLGITIQDLDSVLAERFAGGENSGVLIGDVVSEGPAQQAGLRAGDVLRSIGGKVVNQVSDLRILTASAEPGERIAVEILRDGKTQSVSVRLGELETGLNGAKTGLELSTGLSLAPLNANIARRLGYGTDQKGIFVSRVLAGTAGNLAGLLPGDVILSADGVELHSLAGLNRSIERKPSGIELTIMRSGEKLRGTLSVEARTQGDLR